MEIEPLWVCAFPELGITVSVPCGWFCVQRDWGAHAFPADCAADLAAGHAPGEYLAAWLMPTEGRDASPEGYLQRRLPSGEPEWLSVVAVRGMPTRAASWTDGVCNIVTWFVELDGGGTGAFEICNRWMRERFDVRADA